MYVHECCVFISITPHLSIIPASLQQVSTLLHCYVYVHEPCVFISITPDISIIPASLQRVSTLFTLLCLCTLTLCLHFYHTSFINNTCITTGGKYSFYIVMYMYIHEPSVFISITPHLSIIPASLQQVSTLCTLLCVCT